MIDVLIFVALWCEPLRDLPQGNVEERKCRERLMKCASRRTPINLIFPVYDTDLYWCAYDEGKKK